MTLIALFASFFVFLASLFVLPSHTQYASVTTTATDIFEQVQTATSSAAESKSVPHRAEIEDTASEDSTYSVVKVIDGDTLAVERSGVRETIRLIGIDTPETVDPRRAVQCFGAEASNEAKRLLLGARVTLVSDSTQDTRDKYGRRLAYVYRVDGLFVNEYLVRAGFAYEYTYRAPYRFQSLFEEAELEAQAAKRGLWAPDACARASVPAEATPPQRSAEGIECSKNAYNCSHFKSQTEAQEVFAACGGIANDVHKLDGNGDGEVCESLP